METDETSDLDDPKFRILTEEEILAMPEEEQRQYFISLTKSFLEKEVNSLSRLNKLRANYQENIKLIQTSILRLRARKKNDLFEKLLVVLEEGINSLKTDKIAMELEIKSLEDMYENTNKIYYEIAGETIQTDEIEKSKSKSIDELYSEALEALNREIQEGNFKEVPTQKEINALIDSLPKKEGKYILENFGNFVENKQDNSNLSTTQEIILTEVELEALSVEEQTRYAIRNKKNSVKKFEEVIKNLSEGMKEINKQMKYLNDILELNESISDYILNGQVDRARELYISYSKMTEEKGGEIESFYDLIVNNEKEKITPEFTEALQKMAKEIETYVPEIKDKKEHQEEDTEINYNEVFSRNFEELKIVSYNLKKQVK